MSICLQDIGGHLFTEIMGTVVWLNPRPANTPASQGLSRTLSQLVIWTKILDFSSTDAGAAVALQDN